MKIMEANQPTNPGQKGEAPQRFVTYIRTLEYLYLMRRRRVGMEASPGVHVPQKEIEKHFFTWPAFDRKSEISKLQRAGKIKVTEATNEAGRRVLLYTALQCGPIDLGTIPREPRQFTDLEKWIRASLMTAGMIGERPPYFDFFLQHRDAYLDHFFTVDKFAGRIHTPVTNMEGRQRKRLTIDGMQTISLDVAQMQPQLLGRILTDYVGPNDFSQALDDGQDIYSVIGQRLKLERPQAKEKFFQIIFAPPTDDLIRLFGCSDWINWVNWYKSRFIPGNPHSKLKPHSNLAWLLQNEEVRVMRQIWQGLYDSLISFLTVHDEIIVPLQLAGHAEKIMDRVLGQTFVAYKIKTGLPTLLTTEATGH